MAPRAPRLRRCHTCGGVKAAGSPRHLCESCLAAGARCRHPRKSVADRLWARVDKLGPVPAHSRENILRGFGPPAQAARSSTCMRGHPLAGSNVRITPQGHRLCRTCARARYEQRKGMRAAP